MARRDGSAVKGEAHNQSNYLSGNKLSVAEPFKNMSMYSQERAETRVPDEAGSVGSWPRVHSLQSAALHSRQGLHRTVWAALQEGSRDLY